MCHNIIYVMVTGLLIQNIIDTGKLFPYRFRTVLNSNTRFQTAVRVVDSLQCRSCSSTNSLDTCHVTTCQTNELCHVSDMANLFTTSYSASCLSTTACTILTKDIMQYLDSIEPHHGSRAIHMCDICCGDDLCNTKSCNELKHEMYLLYKDGRLNMTPLSLFGR